MEASAVGITTTATKDRRRGDSQARSPAACRAAPPGAAGVPFFRTAGKAADAGSAGAGTAVALATVAGLPGRLPDVLPDVLPVGATGLTVRIRSAASGI